MKKHTTLKRLTLSTLILAGAVVPAAALEKADFDFNTTKHLYELCSVSEKHADYYAAAYACNGFIEGAIQYHDGVSDGTNLKRLVCYPDGTTVEEGKIAFVAWAETNIDNTDLMAELPVKGLVRALAATYPCDK